MTWGLGSRARRGALLLAAAALGAAPALAVSMRVAALSKIERGRWQVRELDSAVAPVALCLGDAAQILRFAHRNASCQADVFEDGTKGVTIQYSCPGRGFGHTHVRVETPRAMMIDTQGLSNGRPFAYRLEARRVGAC
jgi:hypothetical protein